MPRNKKIRSLRQILRHKESQLKEREVVAGEIVRNAGDERPSATERELSHFIDFKDFLKSVSEKADLERGWVIVVDKSRSYDEFHCGSDEDEDDDCCDCASERKGKQRTEITYYLRTDATEVLHLLNTQPYADLYGQEFIGTSHITSKLSKATVYSSKMEALAQCAFHESLIIEGLALPRDFFNLHLHSLKVMPVVKSYVDGEFAWAHLGRTPASLRPPKLHCAVYRNEK